MSNYVYNLFHGFYVLSSLVYCCNIFTNHMAFRGEGLSNDNGKQREKDEEGDRRN